MHMYQHPKHNKTCPSCKSGNSANCTHHVEFKKMLQYLTILVAKGTDTSLIYENEIQLKDHLGEVSFYLHCLFNHLPLQVCLLFFLLFVLLKTMILQSHTYSLYGAVIRIAHDTNSGHYLSLLRGENSWIKFDDSKVDSIYNSTNYL